MTPGERAFTAYAAATRASGRSPWAEVSAALRARWEAAAAAAITAHAAAVKAGDGPDEARWEAARQLYGALFGAALARAPTPYPWETLWAILGTAPGGHDAWLEVADAAVWF